MKKIFLISAVLLSCIASFAQNEKYIAAMKSNISAIDTSFRNPANLLSLANNFERIATMEKNQWLPYYYAAYCQVNFGFMEKDKSKLDGIADKASELIEKANTLLPQNSEISCIKSMIASCRMMVDPMQRFMQYAQEIEGNMEKAMEQDPTNPRPYLLRGQKLRYMPEQFGGGCNAAKPDLQTALSKFTSFKPESELYPVWGKQRTDMLLKECE